MNRVSGVRPPSEDLDVFLGAFFKGEMPAPWPAFQPPAATRTLPLPRRAARKPRQVFGSRFALAAAVALLLLGGWLLGGRFSTIAEPSLPALGGRGDAVRGLLPPAPAVTPSDNKPVGKVTSSTTLEHKDGRTGVKITLEEQPSNK
jgi:hypothetical protein